MSVILASEAAMEDQVNRARGELHVYILVPTSISLTILFSKIAFDICWI